MIRLSDIITWWTGLKLSLNPMSRVPGWKEADRRERRAWKRRDTKAVHRARAAKQAALHANMRGVA